MVVCTFNAGLQNADKQIEENLKKKSPYSCRIPSGLIKMQERNCEITGYDIAVWHEKKVVVSYRECEFDIDSICGKTTWKINI